MEIGYRKKKRGVDVPLANVQSDIVGGTGGGIVKKRKNKIKKYYMRQGEGGGLHGYMIFVSSENLS